MHRQTSVEITVKLNVLEKTGEDGSALFGCAAHSYEMNGMWLIAPTRNWIATCCGYTGAPKNRDYVTKLFDNLATGRGGFRWEDEPASPLPLWSAVEFDSTIRNIFSEYQHHAPSITCYASVEALSDDAQSVWRLSVAYIGPKSRTERPRKTKIGTEVAHVTRDSHTTFKVRRSKVKVTQGPEAYCGGLPHSLLLQSLLQL